jgi:hypothetical protein
MPGFVSVYSFPRGHSSEGNVPRVDTLFVDFDITGKLYSPDDGRDSEQMWKEELRVLLERIRQVAGALIDGGKNQHWRGSLSGHKGVHLYLDFPEVGVECRSIEEFKMGLKEYTEGLVEKLEDEANTDIDDFVDVSSADLSRLTRMPNTQHTGVEYTDEARYCVPVSIRELAEIDTEQYIKLTSSPRPVPDTCDRQHSDRAGPEIARHIDEADSVTTSISSSTSRYDRGKVEEYKKESNNEIELEDLELLLEDKQFVIEFRQRDDAYKRGTESRHMEIFIMLELINMDVPIDTIVKFFSSIPGFNENYTREMVKDLISRQYERMSISRIKTEAPTFFHSERYD